MGDNFYIHPDFNPEKIGKFRKRNHQTQRSMAPTHIKCNKCGHFLRKGTKQYSKIKKSLTENYFGITIFFLSFRCSDCKAEMVIKTDPENNFYLPIRGCILPFLKMEQERALRLDGDEKENFNEELNQIKNMENIFLKNKKKEKQDKLIEDKLSSSYTLKTIDPNLIVENFHQETKILDERSLNFKNAIELFRKKKKKLKKFSFPKLKKTTTYTFIVKKKKERKKDNDVILNI